MKRFEIMLHDEAIADLYEAINYYQNISPSLGKKFKTAINEAITNLKKNPFYQIRYDNFRLKLVKKFPYLLHFTINEKTQTVFIYGIRNTYQNPETTYFK